MKIKLYIVTYNNSIDLNNNLASLWESNFNSYNSEIFIINNHSEFNLDEKFKEKVKILHNMTRPDFSAGHLSRDWNCALINGFRDLNNPDADVVITVQDDTTYEKDWIERLLEAHQQYSFIAFGIGDQLCSYLPDAVKKIGLWDERFCSLGYGEGDYFLRALIYNKEKSSISDFQHRRVINFIKPSLCHRPLPPDQFSANHSFAYHPLSATIFKHKWGEINPNFWTEELINNPPEKTLSYNYLIAPYFEMNGIENLAEKNYII